MKILIILGVYAIILAFALSRRGVRFQKQISCPSSHPSIKKVLIIGATGGTGRQLVGQVLEAGYSVTALVRNPTRFAVQHERLRVVKGDILDYPIVEDAMRDQDAVLCALGHKQFFLPTRILSGGTANILRAMEIVGVRRLVCETSLGIGNSVGRLGLLYTLFIVPVILPFYFWDKTRQEQLIAESGVDWVIVRPGVLTNAAARGAYQSGSFVGSFLGTVKISRADVAHFMLQQLVDGSNLGKTVGVCW